MICSCPCHDHGGCAVDVALDKAEKQIAAERKAAQESGSYWLRQYQTARRQNQVDLAAANKEVERLTETSVTVNSILGHLADMLNIGWKPADAEHSVPWVDSEDITSAVARLTAENKRLLQEANEDRVLWERRVEAADADADRIRVALAAEQAKVADYENRITWDTTCGNCARLLDASIKDFQRREQAEERIARVEALLPEMEADIPEDAGNATAHLIARRLRAALSTQEDSK